MRMAGRLARLEARGIALPRSNRIVVYDAATGTPLPGFEPERGAQMYIWIPDNGRNSGVEGNRPGSDGSERRCD